MLRKQTLRLIFDDLELKESLNKVINKKQKLFFNNEIVKLGQIRHQLNINLRCDEGD